MNLPILINPEYHEGEKVFFMIHGIICSGEIRCINYHDSGEAKDLDEITREEVRVRGYYKKSERQGILEYHIKVNDIPKECEGNGVFPSTLVGDGRFIAKSIENLFRKLNLEYNERISNQ